MPGNVSPTVTTIIPQPVTGGSDVTVTVTLNQSPTVNTSFLIDTGDRSLVSLGAGLPHTITFAANGGTSQTVTFTTAAVTQNTDVKVVVCDPGTDTTNPTNWRAVGTIVLTP